MDLRGNMDDNVEITLLQDDVEISEPLVADYILPTATANTLGGVKIGDNIQIDNGGHISVPTASAGTLGLIRIGTGLAIDDNGVVTATGEYQLPQATKTTLGGVYVDDELNDESVNPVQNSVITTEISNVSSNLTDLSNTVDTLSDTVSGYSDTISALSDSVTDMADDVAANTSGVASNTYSIQTLTSDVSDLATDVTNQGNAINDMTSTLNDATFVYNDVILFNETDNGTWSEGQVRINRRGKVGALTSTLKGTASALTIPANDEVVVATMTDSTYFPSYPSYASIYTGDVFLQCRINTYGEFIVENNTSSNITIDRIIGTIPIIFV